MTFLFDFSRLTKTDIDGAVHTYKARLLAKGFTQTYGVDYEETFSLVADIRAIRILIAIAAFYDYEISQMDVKTTFLNGHLFEEVYMVQPEGHMKQELMVSCYTDAGYLTDADDLKSQTGYVFVLNKGVVYWKSTKAIAIAKQSRITKGARYYCAKVHYLREVIEYDDVKIEKVHIDDNLVDPFIKALPYPKHLELTKNIGLIPASNLK
nr:putative retrotransposon Ty1-copia subclass protein [Tanacetum cinerariifolium]